MGNCNCLRRWRHSFRPQVQVEAGNFRSFVELGGANLSYVENDPILHPEPGISRPMSQLTEEEQVKIATRMALISTLHSFKYGDHVRYRMTECIICMCEYEDGEELRYLPCFHTYHRSCIDDWLMRSLTCPSCLAELRPTSPLSHSSHSSRGHSSLHSVGRTRMFSPVPQSPQPVMPQSITRVATELHSDSVYTTGPFSYESTTLDMSCDSQKCGDSKITQELVSQPSNDGLIDDLHDDKQKSETDTPIDGNINDNNKSAGDVITHRPLDRPSSTWRASSLPHLPSPHRRTRSIGSSEQQTSLLTERPTQGHRFFQSYRFRRGISTSEISGVNPLQPFNLAVGGGPLELDSGVESGRTEVDPHRQVDGDSHQTPRD